MKDSRSEPVASDVYKLELVGGLLHPLDSEFVSLAISKHGGDFTSETVLGLECN